MNKKLILMGIVILVLVGYFSVARAVQTSFKDGSVDEVITSTTYKKNVDGTISKVEKVTRTTVIDPKAVLQRISDIDNQMTQLNSRKTLLTTQKALLDTVN